MKRSTFLTSKDTETRKRSRSTSSVPAENSDLQPMKQPRGKSSSRITANNNPVFLHGPGVRASLPENEHRNVSKVSQCEDIGAAERLQTSDPLNV